VPLDWGNPPGRQIKVAFAFVPRTDRDHPAEGTIMANPGGPVAAIPSVATIRDATYARQATASLRLDDHGTTHTVALSWTPFRPGEPATVHGDLDGHPFTTTIA
jgi:hypothetical protein